MSKNDVSVQDAKGRKQRLEETLFNLVEQYARETGVTVTNVVFSWSTRNERPFYNVTVTAEV